MPADEMGARCERLDRQRKLLSRVFGLVDTGEFGDAGVSGWLAVSYQTYDKFKGPGDLTKCQTNGRMFWDMGDGDFVSLAAHFNVNRNDFYRNLHQPQAQFNSAARLPRQSGRPAPADAPTTGAAENDEHPVDHLVDPDFRTAR